MAKPKSVSRSGRSSETSVGANDGERPEGESVGGGRVLGPDSDARALVLPDRFGSDRANHRGG